MPSQEEFQNRLAKELSPYLLQHATNPVDWYPWGPEAFERANKEGKLVLLSIGYSACHWCHVMEKESFEDVEIAKLMNQYYICIKVDREERPDIDEIYMAATLAVNHGRGGWPMTLFLLPNAKPFFAGTYFPPENHASYPGFKNLLIQIAEIWFENKDRLISQAEGLTDTLKSLFQKKSKKILEVSFLEAYFKHLNSLFDVQWGGFGEAPKFPPHIAMDVLMRYHKRKQDKKSLAMLTKTFDGMIRGGIYDHIGGGFSRYAVDEKWHVPHFEKMLYDNAMILKNLALAYQLTRRHGYLSVMRDTVEFVSREMTSKEGGFYSAIDADSEGIEGWYYTWTNVELSDALPEEEFYYFAAFYDVSDEGNWEGRNVLWMPYPLKDLAKSFDIDEKALHTQIGKSRKKIFKKRCQRIAPKIDDKILLSWNALMISALSEIYLLTRNKTYAEVLLKATDFILGNMRDDKGHLLRVFRLGKAHVLAFLDDYAFFIEALISVYEIGESEEYLNLALSYAEEMIQLFYDDETESFLRSSVLHDTLYLKHREGSDGVLPNGNAVAAQGLLRLSYHFFRQDFRDLAHKVLRSYGEQIEEHPYYFGSSLAVLDRFMDAPVEIALLGEEGENMEELWHELGQHYLPNRVIAHSMGGSRQSLLPMLKDKTRIKDKAQAYVCKNYVCKKPVSTAKELKKLMGD